MVRSYNLSTQGAKEGGSQIQCQPGLHSETLTQKKEINGNLHSYLPTLRVTEGRI